MSDLGTYVLRGFDFAACTAVFTQGILCSQFVWYMTESKRTSEPESLLLKLFVGGLALLTTMKTVQALAMSWLQNCAMFENMAAADALFTTNWVFLTTLLTSAVISFYVQMFFCYRLWTLSRNLYLVAAVSALLILALAQACVAAYAVFTDVPKSIKWTAAHRGVAMCGDVLLTAGTVFALLRHSKIALPRGQTAQILNALLRLTLQSAAPSATCAFINFVVAIQMSRPNMALADLRPILVITEVTNMLLPKLYAISAMWTLNLRAEIRAAAAENSGTIDIGFGDLNTSVLSVDSEEKREVEPSVRVNQSANSEPQLGSTPDQPHSSMRIDVHQHLWPQPFLDALRARTAPPRLDGWTLHTTSAPPYEVNPADHDVASRASQPLGIEWLPATEAAPLLAAYHAGVLALPAQFRAWAAAGLDEIDAAALGRLLDAGCVGLQLPADALLDPAGWERCGPLLRLLETRGAPLFVHPGRHAPAAGARMPAWWPAVGPYVHQMHDAWYAFGLFGRPAHPRLRVCFALLAGLGPVHGERVAARGGPAGGEVDPDAFVETSSYGPRAVGAVVGALGVGVVVLGSDRPYASVPEFGFGEAFDYAVAVANPARLLYGTKDGQTRV
ncbi:hypothetical protein B0H12DRAFT_1323127 [Mycena haematopus]|nr:hypothetical protein B0H12DRAFT_1323127 [Mycena haematopus]